MPAWLHSTSAALRMLMSCWKRGSSSRPVEKLADHRAVPASPSRGVVRQAGRRSPGTGGPTRRFLTAREDLPLVNVAYTLGTGRSHFPNVWRWSRNRPTRRFQRGGLPDRSELAERVSRSGSQDGRQGRFPYRPRAQHAGMGRELYHTQPAFRRMEQCNNFSADNLERPLLQLLSTSTPSASPSTKTAHANRRCSPSSTRSSNSGSRGASSPIQSWGIALASTSPRASPESFLWPTA